MKRADKKQRDIDLHIPFMAEDPDKKEARLKQNIMKTLMEANDSELEDDPTGAKLNKRSIQAGQDMVSEMTDDEETDADTEEKKQKSGIEIIAEGILAAMKRGCTKEELCLELGLTPTRLTKLEREHDVIREALEDGEIYSRAWWLKTGRVALNSNSFNTGLWKTMMANRFGFSGETGDGARPVNNFYTNINIASLSPDTVKEVSDSLLDKPLLPDWGDWKKNG